jgi:arylsulfatase A-like enzyme
MTTTTTPRTDRLAPLRRHESRQEAAPAEGTAPLGPAGTFVVALWFALANGFVSLLAELARGYLQGHIVRLGRYQLHQHYFWMIPATSLLIFGAVTVPLCLIVWLRPRLGARCVFLVLAFLSGVTVLSLLRALDPSAGTILAAGIAFCLEPVLNRRSDAVRALALRTLPLLVLIGAGLVVFSFAQLGWSEHRALANRPAAPAGAPNVLLIVLDATRADALSVYGAERNTTPYLADLARHATVFDRARASAPWTLPSHASMFTGRWPHELNVGPDRPLGTIRFPTLAEVLRRRGYATAGFAANYAFCGVSYGLNRGFAHYDDRPISLDDTLGCTSIGRRVMPLVESIRDAWSRYVCGELRFNGTDPDYTTRSRSAEEINVNFLQWLTTQQKDRPFFAFLNYYDAHAPYVAPKEWTKHFGAVPDTADEFQMLRTWEEDWHLWNPLRQGGTVHPSEHDLTMARDGYDDCVAYMDEQLRRLFTALERRGVLENTLVIVTADHGEGFGEHGLYCHYASVHRSEIDVPLLLYWREHVPQGVRVLEPVSLRAIPSTVLDLIGMNEGSPFPGQSLARLWQTRQPGIQPYIEPVLSELEETSARAVMMGTKVYIWYGDGVEQLFDHQHDPTEDNNLMGYPGRRPEAGPFRDELAKLIEQQFVPF